MTGQHAHMQAKPQLFTLYVQVYELCVNLKNALAVQTGRLQAARQPCRLTVCLARLKNPAKLSNTPQQGNVHLCVKFMFRRLWMLPQAGQYRQLQDAG